MNMMKRKITRRCFASAVSTIAVGTALHRAQGAEGPAPLRLKYMLASSMYGYTSMEEVLPEVRKTGATAIDLWPKPHGDQREQLDEIGEAKFSELLEQHSISLGCITQYHLGPFGLKDEMRLAQRLGCPTIVTGATGPSGLSGTELKSAVTKFVEAMKPHVAIAEEAGVTIAIENHGANLIESPDAMKWLAELSPSKHLGIALAPYHLPQQETLIADLIETLSPAITVFYAWEHGMGCMDKLPKDQELKQMPGRGTLDFGPLLDALTRIKFTGWTEIFMHPVPRGIPILETTAAVTEEINRSRTYLNQILTR